jgi:hypothetical protein
MTIGDHMMDLLARDRRLRIAQTIFGLLFLAAGYVEFYIFPRYLHTQMDSWIVSSICTASFLCSGLIQVCRPRIECPRCHDDLKEPGVYLRNPLPLWRCPMCNADFSQPMPGGVR